jgi:hypothetical protein
MLRKHLKSFKMPGYRLYNTKHLILPALGTWHMGSRWCTPDFSLVPLTFKHLSHLPPTLEFQRRRQKYQVSVNIEVTACITLASAANRLLARCFLRCSKRWKSLSPILLTGLVTRYGTMAGRLCTIRPRVPASVTLTWQDSK